MPYLAIGFEAWISSRADNRDTSFVDGEEVIATPESGGTWHVAHMAGHISDKTRPYVPTEYIVDSPNVVVGPPNIIGKARRLMGMDYALKNLRHVEDNGIYRPIDTEIYLYLKRVFMLGEYQAEDIVRQVKKWILETTHA